MGMNLFCEKYTVAWRGPVLWISNEQLYATRFISILLYLLKNLKKNQKLKNAINFQLVTVL